MTASKPIQTIINSDWIFATVETDTPTPVPMAMYAARQTGHLGINIRMAPGTSHLKDVRILQFFAEARK